LIHEQNFSGCQISMKKLISIVAALVLAALLAGCGAMDRKAVEFDRRVSDPNVLTSGYWIQRGYISD
jgi:hypothetical protein